MRSVAIFDNGGASYDRFTILYRKTGDVYGASHNPFEPTGFGCFNGNVTDKMLITYGANWEKRFNYNKVLKEEVRSYINEAKNNPTWLGKKVKLSELPDDVKKYVKQIITE